MTGRLVTWRHARCFGWHPIAGHGALEVLLAHYEFGHHGFDAGIFGEAIRHDEFVSGDRGQPDLSEVNVERGGIRCRRDPEWKVLKFGCTPDGE